ncbi:MAG: hypothetical protein ACKOW3_02170, partial [Hyphomicrobium sp.]
MNFVLWFDCAMGLPKQSANTSLSRRSADRLDFFNPGHQLRPVFITRQERENSQEGRRGVS